MSASRASATGAYTTVFIYCGAAFVLPRGKGLRERPRDRRSDLHSLVELIEAYTNPSPDLGQLISVFPALQFTQTVPDHFAGVVVGSGSDQLIDESRKLARKGNVSCMNCGHVCLRADGGKPNTGGKKRHTLSLCRVPCRHSRAADPSVTDPFTLPQPSLSRSHRRPPTP